MTASSASVSSVSSGPSRRSFLAGAVAATGLATTAVNLTPGFTARAGAQAGPPGRLVVVYLRGGQDHLSTVVPYGDSNYYAARPTIAIPDTEVLDLDGTFGFHPVMAGLHSLFTTGRLSVVVGAGNPVGDRSHFTAQDLSEYGAETTPSDGFGWLARYLRAPSSSSSLFRALTVGNNVHLSLRGFDALGMASIAGFGLGETGLAAQSTDLLKMAYSGGASIERVGTTALSAADIVGGLPRSTSADPNTAVFEDTANLLEADLGTEVITINLGGWDSHDAMGTWDDGEMRYLLGGLDTALGAFQSDLDSRGLDDVTTLVMTEFGRRVIENGSGGTDHGHASVMLVLGDAATGGVFGTVAPLTPGSIGPRNDVPVTVDFRDVLGDVAGSVLGVANPSDLFPGHSYQPQGTV